MKTCSKCEIPKEETEDNFYRVKRTGKFRACCKACHNRDNIDRAAANPKRHNARSKAWREANPEKWAATTKRWREANPERIRINSRRSRFKVDFEALWEAQKGLCACCGDPMLPSGRQKESVCVDHDWACCPSERSCGKCVRGLIHWSCNLVLGYSKDDLRVLRGAVAYLERWQTRPFDSSYQPPFPELPTRLETGS